MNRVPSCSAAAASLQRSRLEGERGDLANATGRYRNHPVAQSLSSQRMSPTIHCHTYRYL